MGSQWGCYSICSIKQNQRWMIRRPREVTLIKSLTLLLPVRPRHNFYIFRNPWLKELPSPGWRILQYHDKYTWQSFPSPSPKRPMAIYLGGLLLGKEEYPNTVLKLTLTPGDLKCPYVSQVNKILAKVWLTAGSLASQTLPVVSSLSPNR